MTRKTRRAGPWRRHEMQKRMRLFAGRSADEVSLACIARSFEQQRAIYGITPMINGAALARGTLPPCFPILLCPSAYSSLSLYLSISLPRVCPTAYVRRRATSHRPILGPTAPGPSELGCTRAGRRTVRLPYKKAYNVKPALPVPTISHPPVRPSVCLFLSSSCLLDLI